MIKFNNNFDLITFKHLLFNYFEQNYMYIINEVRRYVDSRVIVALPSSVLARIWGYAKATK